MRTFIQFLRMPLIGDFAFEILFYGLLISVGIVLGLGYVITTLS